MQLLTNRGVELMVDVTTMMTKFLTLIPVAVCLCVSNCRC